MSENKINSERIKQLLEQRKEGFTSLLTSDNQSKEEVQQERSEGADVNASQTVEEVYISNDDRTRYNLLISSQNVEFLKRYAFTKGSRLLRLYTMAEAIDDAIHSLRVHYNEPLLVLPEYKKNKKNKRK